MSLIYAIIMHMLVGFMCVWSDGDLYLFACSLQVFINFFVTCKVLLECITCTGKFSHS